MVVQAIGMIMQAVGAVHTGIGAYYGARAQKLTLKAQASALEYQQRMAQLNQRIVAREAVSEFQQAQKMIGQRTMQHGQAQAQARASMAARGIQAGVGSAGEIMASMEYAKQAESMAMNAQAVRQREDMMMQRTNVATQGIMAGAQAEGLRGMADAIMPIAHLMVGLTSSGGQVLSQWANTQQTRQSATDNQWTPAPKRGHSSSLLGF